MLRLLGIPFGLIVALVLSMIWSGGGAQKRADFAFINRGDINTLDLNDMSYVQDFRITYAIREGLYSYHPTTLKPIPAGAVGCDVSPDNRVWTFHLRPGARWSNGDPITAKDYIFSWRRMLESPGEYTYLFYYIKNAERYSRDFADGKAADFASIGVESPDPLTLKVTLLYPVPYFLELVAFCPFYPRHEASMEPFKIVDAGTGHITYRDEYTRPPGVVTNGPFVLKQWDFKRRLLMVKSDTYWDKANVKSDTIEMAVNENPLSQFLEYETGKVDWTADVSGDLAADLKARGRTDLHVSPAFGTMFLTLMTAPRLPAGMGGGPNPLADVRVRQALAMSINKQFIVDNITRMGELPARTYIPPDGTLSDFTWLPGPFDPDRSKHYSFTDVRRLLSSAPAAAGPGLPYDIETARRLLADAGYPNGEHFPPLPIIYSTASTTSAAMTQVLKNQWKLALGIDVNIQSQETKVLRHRLNEKDYCIAPTSWYGDYPDAATYTDKYRSTSLQNDCAFLSPEYDGLCDAALQEENPAKRVLLLSQATALLDDQVPIIPIYYYTMTSLSRVNVHGVLPNPRGTILFKAVYVSKD